jgi:hypothetical protein
MSKSMKALVLAGILSIAAASAARAGGHGTSGDFRGGAHTAPACDTHRCPVLATDGPGGPTDNTGRSHASAAPACGDQCPVLASEGPGSPTDGTGRSGARMASDGPGGPTDGTGRSAEVTKWHPMLAGGGVRTGDISV